MRIKLVVRVVVDVETLVVVSVLVRILVASVEEESVVLKLDIELSAVLEVVVSIKKR
jgi:hypothetical protein